MDFIRDTNWQKVFDGWRDREANNPGWVNCAVNIKGWSDWESWRAFTAEQFDAANREWKIFQFLDPIHEVPEMLIGPFSGWQARVENKNKTTFSQLLNIPSQFEEFSKHSGVLKILAGLPFSTELIGILRKDINKIVCLEGHHRATAIALAEKQGQQIDFSKSQITIALTELEINDCQLLDKMLLRGTSKNPSN